MDEASKQLDQTLTKCWQNLVKISSIFRNVCKFLKILMNSNKIREIPINFHQNENENDKIQENWQNPDILRFFKPKKSSNSENGAVRRNVNLVDLEKCCKMTIWLLS